MESKIPLKRERRNIVDFEKAKEIMWEKLGISKIMALASCENNYPMVRNISALIYDDRIWFKTDKNFRKTQQLIANPRVALCWNGTQVEGTARITGLVTEEPGRKFENCTENISGRVTMLIPMRIQKFWWRSLPILLRSGMKMRTAMPIRFSLISKRKKHSGRTTIKQNITIRENIQTEFSLFI